MLMIDPERCEIICGATARMPRNTPVWLIATSRSQSSNDVCVIVAHSSTPALLTSTSSRPRSRTTCSTTSAHRSGDVTSCSTKVAPMSAAVLAPSSARTSVTNTWAPSLANSRASAAPCPRAAPVTSATRLSSFPMPPALQAPPKSARSYAPVRHALGLAEVLGSPPDLGTVELIVRRPAVDEREVLEVGTLDPTWGLVGDTWRDRRARTPDGTPHPDTQLNVINARFARLVAVDPDRRALAGDQLHLDLDLSEANLPTGARLALGDAIIEVTAEPHTGCAKFSARFGRDAMKFANSPQGRALRLRGLNARVVVAGTVRAGDQVRKTN